MSKASSLSALAETATWRCSPGSLRCALIKPEASPIGTVVMVRVGMNPPKNEAK